MTTFGVGRNASHNEPRRRPVGSNTGNMGGVAAEASPSHGLKRCGQLYAAPVIRSEITDGKVQITGNFTEEQATQLATRISESISQQ